MSQSEKWEGGGLTEGLAKVLGLTGEAGREVSPLSVGLNTQRRQLAHIYPLGLQLRLQCLHFGSLLQLLYPEVEQLVTDLPEGTRKVQLSTKEGLKRHNRICCAPCN